MTIFTSTLNQTAFLFGIIIIGYLLVKLKVLPENSATVLSKLENTVFIPAMVMGTFIENFTVERIGTAWKLLLISFLIALVVIPVATLSSKLVTKDKYLQKIYTYGLCFANFGFMGNAVVSTLFPDVFFEYLIFTLPLWTLIYVWGAPRLLIANSGEKQSFKDSLKSFINPMFIAMIIGMIIGLTGLKLPTWFVSIVDVSGDCMSPVAMILTGIVISSISLKKAFTNVRTYAISIIRLIVFPMLFVLISSFIKLPETIYVCALCSLAMPLGLNTIVIPSAYGKDTTEAAGMAVISHILAVITIPIIFTLI
ncbi:MAG: hypothetical protein E7582_04015 [Ruminococcaceae bacterium]|nr:hypothetical protein [Oscillospiraceae bacterium]